MVSLAEVKELKVAELREELKARGLETSGLKPALVSRLEEALRASQGTSAAQQVAPTIATVSAPATATDAAPKAATNARATINFKASNTPAVETSKQAAENASGPTPIQPTVLSEAEKRKQRADRFGIPASQEEKKAQRAERFGLAQKADTKSTTAGSEGITPLTQADKAALEEKKKDRAKRFNLPVTLSKEEIEKQKKARLDRFGQTTNGTSTNGGISAAKGDDSANLQAKLAARAERFALNKSAPQTGSDKETPKPVEVTKPLDPVAEAKRKAREIKFVGK